MKMVCIQIPQGGLVWFWIRPKNGSGSAKLIVLYLGIFLRSQLWMLDVSAENQTSSSFSTPATLISQSKVILKEILLFQSGKSISYSIRNSIQLSKFE